MADRDPGTNQKEPDPKAAVRSSKQGLEGQDDPHDLPGVGSADESSSDSDRPHTTMSNTPTSDGEAVPG